VSGNNTYIRSSDPKGFKTLDLVAEQIVAENSTNASKLKKSKMYKGKIGGRLFRQAA
jgi:hypothetical protein